MGNNEKGSYEKAASSNTDIRPQYPYENVKSEKSRVSKYNVSNLSLLGHKKKNRNQSNRGG